MITSSEVTRAITMIDVILAQDIHENDRRQVMIRRQELESIRYQVMTKQPGQPSATPALRDWRDTETKLPSTFDELVAPVLQLTSVKKLNQQLADRAAETGRTILSNIAGGQEIPLTPEPTHLAPAPETSVIEELAGSSEVTQVLDGETAQDIANAENEGMPPVDPNEPTNPPRPKSGE